MWRLQRPGRNLTTADALTSQPAIATATATKLDALAEVWWSDLLLADADMDGICDDDVDPCVGELDACGICNGPGDDRRVRMLRHPSR